METKHLGTVNGVIFNKAPTIIKAELVELDQQGICISEVKKSAKELGLPTEGWFKSDYTESYLLSIV